MELLSVAKSIENILREVPWARNDCAKIDDLISELESGLVNVCVYGEFSSGKSSVINSLISYSLLPTADRPLTSKVIEIKHSETPYLICRWSCRLKRSEARIVKKALTTIESERAIACKEKIGKRISWIDGMSDMEYRAPDIVCLKNFLWILEASRYDDMRFSDVKKSPKVFAVADIIRKIWRSFCREHETSKRKVQKLPIHAEEIDKIEIGLRLPDGLKNARFIDAPGEGSIYAYGAITKNPLQTSQMILHVFDAEHIGSKLTDEMIGDAKRHDATTAYILNKRDTLNDSSLADALSILREKYEIDPIAVSALYENCSRMLADGICKPESIMDNPKVNLTPVILSGEWNPDNVEKNKKLLIKYLHETSNTESLRSQVASFMETQRDLAHDFFRDALREIAESCLRKAKHLIEERENSPKRKKLLSDINFLRKLCQDVEDFRKNEVRNFGVSCACVIKKTLENIKIEFDKALSNSLTLSFSRFERKLKSAVDSSLSFPVAYELKDAVDSCFEKYRFRCEDYISVNKLGIEMSHFRSLDFGAESDFLRLMQKETCSILRPILKDTVKKPWMSFFRPEALETYRKKKRQKCMLTWRVKIIGVLSTERKLMVDLCKRAAKELFLPLSNFVKDKTSELKTLEQSLLDLEKELFGNVQYLNFCDVKRDLDEQVKILKGGRE